LGNFKTDAQGNGKGSTTDKLIKLIGPESVIGVSVTLTVTALLLIYSSVLWLSTLELMILARETMKSQRRLVMPALGLHAVRFS
jgi:hypothetical protein